MDNQHFFKIVFLLILVYNVKGECPEGYYNEWGWVSGWGQIRGNFESTMTDCGAECTNTTECCSFEFSYTSRLCNLNTDCAPTHVKYSDYYNCIKDRDLAICEGAPTIVESNDDSKDTTGENVLNDCNENATTKYWKAPAGKSGSEAELVLDIGCLIRLERISLRNGFGDFGTNQYSIWGARSETAPWISLLNGTLPIGGETECSEDLLYFGISGTVDQQSSLVSRVKFRVETFHGEAGGLQFLAVHGPVRKSKCHCAMEQKSSLGKCTTTRLNDVADLQYNCYYWTPADLDVVSGASAVVQKKHCEETLGHVYSGGDNSKAPGCGTCVCCAKKILEEEWMFWCEVDDGEECEDVKEGRSFEACLSGCPHPTTIAIAHSQNNDTLNDVLHDKCEEDEGQWIAPEGAVDDDATLILNLGCPQKITSVLIKNLRSDLGGTKEFSIYIGNNLVGPWELMGTGEINQTETCTDEMEIIRIKKEIGMETGMLVKFQINSFHGSQGGLQYIKIFGDSVAGFANKACYDARTSGEIGWVKTDPPPPVAKSHCDLLSYITFKDDGFMKPFCEGDCSCCRPKQTEVKYIEEETTMLDVHYRNWNYDGPTAEIFLMPESTLRNTKDNYIGQTFCLRVMFTGFMLDASNIIKFEKPGTKTISMEWSIFKPQKNGQQFGILSLDLGMESLQFINIVELFDKVLPFEWNSFCISLSPEKVLVYHNGRVQGTQTLTENGDGNHLKMMTTGLIGGAKFTGILSDLQIFSREMSGEDLGKWTECQNQLIGDLFSLKRDFKDIKLQLGDKNLKIKMKSMRPSSLCRSKEVMSKVFEAFNDNINKQARNAGKIFCESLNGLLAKFPNSYENFKSLLDYKTRLMTTLNISSISTPVNAKSYSIKPEIPSIGYPDGGYLDIFDLITGTSIIPDEKVKKSISKDHFSYQSREELCYLMDSMKDETPPSGFNSEKSWFVTQMCSRNIDGWTVCEFKQNIFISLSGLCEASPVDKIFALVAPNKDETARYGTFVGATGWVLEFSTQHNTWLIKHYFYEENTLKLLDARRRPFGKNSWEVGNYACNLGQTSILQLQLSNCDPDQFTCGDGSCVPLAKRCDKQQDCEDLSDEKKCQIVALDEERYLKDDAPPPIIAGENVDVTLSMNIQNILDIQEVQQRLALKFDLEEKWLDSRLQFYNLKPDQEMNTLVYEEKNMIWIPRILFSNTKNDLTSERDEKSFAKVVRNMNFNGSLIGPEVSEDILVYEGRLNQIKINRVYEVEFICTYDMIYYPFDIQTCTLDMVIHGNTAKFINLLPGMLKYTGGSDFAQYYVMDYNIYNSKIKDKMGVKVSLRLGRRLLGTILTVYVPTILLNVIGHTTNYFKDFFFEAIVTVNLTCMLVLVTMFISVSNGLPKTSYLKMMDYWLVFNLLLPFLEVIFHTYIEMLNDEEGRIINHHGKAREVNSKESDDKSNKVGPESVEDDDKLFQSRSDLEKAKKPKKTMNQRKQEFCHKIGHVYTPTIALTFVTIYWFVGLKNAEYF